jgi:O-antigen/teichoic acid export membrane protein
MEKKRPYRHDGMTMNRPIETSTPKEGFITRGFGRDLVWSLAGQCTPVLAAVFTIPVLIRTLGADRFGILALAWTLVGYFNLFDLGMGRALAQVVAEKRGQNDAREIPPLVWTTLLCTVGLGCIAALLLNLAAPWLVYRALKVPEDLRLESLQSLRLLSVCIPVVMGAAALRGVLEAHERFRETNALRILTGFLIFLGPMLVLPFSTQLLPIVAVLAVTRGLDGAAHLWLCTRLLSWPRLSGGMDRLLPLFRLGGWMTLSNIVSPLMVYLDRFFIGSLISMAAVAYYTVPYDMVANMGTIPAALVVILFPAFSAHHKLDPDRARRLFGQGIRTAAIALLPLTVIVIALSDVGLRWWVGAEFADHGARVLRWLALGRFVNGLAQIPLAFLQGIGRPDLPAKLHLIELPLYAALAWGLTRAWGIEGTAVAWGARVALDAFFLFAMTRRFLRGDSAVLRG